MKYFIQNGRILTIRENPDPNTIIIETEKKMMDMKCEVCKERDFTLIFDGTKICITCYDEWRARVKANLPSALESDKSEQK